MAKLSNTLTAQIKNLSRQQLEKLVLKAAKDQSFHDYLLVHYFDKEFGEQDLFEKAKSDLEMYFRKSYKGYSEELQLANMLAACHKRINEFAKVCKKKELELDLVMLVLKIPFSLSTNLFCTCFTNFNYRVFLLVKKAIGILENKLHNDFKIEYAGTLNNYLEVLHRTSSHIDAVYKMPKSI